MTLREFFKYYKKAALAFSGGVDSSFLLYAAKKYGCDVKPYFVKSQFQPAFELEDARRIADLIGVPITVLTCDILSNDKVRCNHADRCYHCKSAIMSKIISAAKADGYNVLLDGTNATDDSGDRPGMRVLAEIGVLSPLKLCGLTKAEIRRLSRAAKLFTHNKPAYACLATRIPTGTALDAETLIKVEKAEEYLFKLGFTDFRMRVIGKEAKLQVPENQILRAAKLKGQIMEELTPGFESVLLDLKGR